MGGRERASAAEDGPNRLRRPVATMGTAMPHPHAAAFESPLVVASSRGPASFRRDEDGALVADRGSGGLVTAIAGVLFESDATWLACAMTDGDREIAASGATTA